MSRGTGFKIEPVGNWALGENVTKKLGIFMATLFLSLSSFAQGTIFFNNRTSTGDAPFGFWDSSGKIVGLGAGFSAQLYLVTVSGASSTLTPLTPATTFRTSSPDAAYFIHPLDIVVPGVPAGQPATFRMRAYETSAGSYEAAVVRLESSNVFVSQLGGITPSGGIVPTPDLAGLHGVTIPEPSTIALGILGAAALLYRRRK